MGQKKHKKARKLLIRRKISERGSENFFKHYNKVVRNLVAFEKMTVQVLLGLFKRNIHEID